ncbi:unnamed protein product [Porites evermanni]|uniref:SIN1-type PH domain-containing protein n=2 Tax=Porites TaxID=46719 RepID=A0ABN8LND0_9CNID|nr:unnamed protein product [Porites evermanni]
MENVVDCQLMEEKSNGKSLFRVIYFSHNARDFKHYDFEAESDMSGEVVKQVNHIIRSKIGGVRSEYLATKEKKLEKRRSFKY